MSCDVRLKRIIDAHVDTGSLLRNLCDLKLMRLGLIRD